MTNPLRTRPAGERGVTLLETVVATAILFVALSGLASLSTVATTSTENNGHLEARTTEYAQDKLEQLLALAWGDTTSDTTVFPAANTGGTGLAPGGAVSGAPQAGYVDYLDVNGNLLGGGVNPPANWYYRRVWQVTSPSANLKLVTVTASVNWSLGRTILPSSNVTALKTFPF